MSEDVAIREDRISLGVAGRAAMNGARCVFGRAPPCIHGGLNGGRASPCIHGGPNGRFGGDDLRAGRIPLTLRTTRGPREGRLVNPENSRRRS